LRNIKINLHLNKFCDVHKVILEPQGKEIPFLVNNTGGISFVVEEFSCHQMVSINMK